MTTNARILRSLSIASRSPVRRPKLLGSTNVPNFPFRTFSVETSSSGTRSESVSSAVACPERAFGDAFVALSVPDFGCPFLLHESKHKTGSANNRHRVPRRYFTTKPSSHARRVDGDDPML